jgi:integrase
MIERHGLDWFGSKRLRDIRPPHLRAYAEHLRGEGMQPGTVKLNIAPIRCMFATAVEDGLLRHNPCTGIRLAQTAETVEGEDDERAKALTEEQLAKLIAAVPAKHWLFVTFMAHTGVRISEAIALRWGDFDFPRMRVRIGRRIYRGTVAPPKSKYGRRTIPLAPGLSESLLERREATGASGDDLCFPSSSGKPFVPSNFAHDTFKPAAERAGVGWASFHTLRHTAATMLFSRGANAVQVQHVLGHHSPAFTLSVYVHLLPDDLPDVAFLDDVTKPGGQTTGQTEPSQTQPDEIPAEVAKVAA